MATKRHRHGLMHYQPKAATAARYRKGTAGPKQRARLERKVKARGRLPAPGTAAGRRAAARLAPHNAEWVAIRNGAIAETLGRGHQYEGYGALLREFEDEHYRKLYAERQAERRAAGTIKPRKARPKSARIRVRSYWRRRAHR